MHQARVSFHNVVPKVLGQFSKWIFQKWPYFSSITFCLPSYARILSNEQVSTKWTCSKVFNFHHDQLTRVNIKTAFVVWSLETSKCGSRWTRVSDPQIKQRNGSPDHNLRLASSPAHCLQRSPEAPTRTRARVPSPKFTGCLLGLSPPVKAPLKPEWVSALQRPTGATGTLGRGAAQQQTLGGPRRG